MAIWYRINTSADSITLANFRDYQDGSYSTEWTPGNAICDNISNMTIKLVTNIFTLPSDSTSLFKGFKGVIPDLDKFNTSQVTVMENLFYGCTGNNSFSLCNNWDVSSVKNMARMFYGCVINDFNLSNWDTSSVTTMNEMFSLATGTSSIDISSWDTSNVTSMQGMFNRCEVAGINVNGINTRNVTHFANMFSGLNYSSLDLSSFDTSSALYMSSMFWNSPNLKTINGIENFKTSNVIEMDEMFLSCSSLEELNLSSWDVSSCEDFTGMFRLCTSLKSIDIRGWDLSKAYNLKLMFKNCYNLEWIRIEGVKVKTTGQYVQDTTEMFGNCSKLSRIYADPNTDWYKPGIAVLYGPTMFLDCTSLPPWDGETGAERANNIRDRGYFGLWDGYYDSLSYEKINNNWVKVNIYQKNNNSWVMHDVKAKYNDYS